MSAEVAGPVARALLALETIQAAPGITADALARRLGVSDRAARRYVQTLREADIPVESTPGRYGGYRLGRSFRLPPLMLTTAEALGLLMAVLPGSEDPDAAADDDTVAHSARRRAVTKILRVLPAPVAASAQLLRTVHRSRRSGAPQPDPELVAILVRAVDDARLVGFRYRLSSQESRRMTVAPWAVVLRHELWYLLCWSHTSNARRLLRIDRMGEVAVQTETFSTPTDLDVLEVVEQHLSEGWRHDAVIDFEASIGEVQHWIPRSMGSLEPLPGSGCRLIGTTQDLRWFLGVLVEIPLAFRIIGGAELRGAAQDAARRLLAPPLDR